MKGAFIPWHDGYLEYSFSNHLFTSKKYELFRQKILSSPFSKYLTLIKHPIEWQYLERAINQKHLERLKRMSESGEGLIDPGTPAFKDMLFPARLSAQGTYESIMGVLSGRYKFAFNCLGGFHHATPTISRGGCIINDMGVAMKRIRHEGIISRIAILDFDYHPHDGTTAYFGGDASVFSASIHETGWFDHDDNEIGWGEGEGTVWNRGIRKLIAPEEYLQIITEELIPSVEKFKPEALLFLNGIDAHSDDPVVQKYPRRAISLKNEHFKKIAEIVAEFALKECNGKVVGLGAGGYGPEITANTWLQTVELFSQKLLGSTT